MLLWGRENGKNRGIKGGEDLESSSPRGSGVRFPPAACAKCAAQGEIAGTRIPALRCRFPESPSDGCNAEALFLPKPVFPINGETFLTRVIRTLLLSPPFPLSVFSLVHGSFPSLSGLQGH